MNISLIQADNKHIDYFFSWVNEDDSITNKLHTKKKICYMEHKKWYSERINDQNSCLWVLKYNEEYIGQIRYEKVINPYNDIDIYIIKKYRKKNIASEALQISLKKFSKRPIRAIVRKNNIASYYFFLKNNFILDFDNADIWQLIKK